jgi:sphingoid base N-palmitoyltransferase
MPARPTHLLIQNFTIPYRYIFKPFGLWRGLKEKPVQVPENGILEKAYLAKKASLTPQQIRGLAKQTDMTENQVQHWFRKRQSRDRPTPLTKLMESGWRFTFYSFMVVYGVSVLWDKPWFWDIKQCWINYPHQVIN